MPANTNPIFGLTPNTKHATIAAANTARDGSGTLVSLLTAGTNGSLLFSIKFTSAQATAAANSAAIWRVWITDAAGANPRLAEEVQMAAVTASNTVVGSTATVTFGTGLLLEPSQQIKVTQSVYAGAQDQTHVLARAIDY